MLWVYNHYKNFKFPVRGSYLYVRKMPPEFSADHFFIFLLNSLGIYIITNLKTHFPAMIYIFVDKHVSMSYQAYAFFKCIFGIPTLFFTKIRLFDTRSYSYFLYLYDLTYSITYYIGIRLKKTIFI